MKGHLGVSICDHRHTDLCVHTKFEMASEWRRAIETVLQYLRDGCSLLSLSLSLLGDDVTLNAHK